MSVVLLGYGYVRGLGGRRSLRLRSNGASRQSGDRRISCPSPFIKCDAFIDQLLQVIQFLLPYVDKPNPECSIDSPLHLGLLDHDRDVVSWDNQLDGDLSAWLNDEGTFDPGPAER